MYKQLSLFPSLAAPALIVFTLWTTKSNRHGGGGTVEGKLFINFVLCSHTSPRRHSHPNYSSFLWVFKERLSGCLRNTSPEKTKPEYYALRVHRNQNKRTIYIFSSFFQEQGHHWELNDSYGISLCGIYYF